MEMPCVVPSGMGMPCGRPVPRHRNGRWGHGLPALSSCDVEWSFEPATVDPTGRPCRSLLPEWFDRSCWWCPSYIFDYIVLGILAGALILEGTLWNPWVKPYDAAPTTANGGFAWNDNQFQFPMRDDTFKIWVTVLISFIAPIIIFILYHIFTRLLSWRENTFHDLHHSIMGIATALVIGYFIWFPINKTTGSFRPDFWYRLQTGNSKTIAEGREAFPSGHTVMAFLGLGFFSLWLCGKMRVFHSTRGNLWRYFLAVICPMSLACAQAVTRVTDFRHHTVDILGGAVVGMFAAISAYLLFYPPVYAPDCDHPKNRKWGYPSYLLAGIPLAAERPMGAAAPQLIQQPVQLIVVPPEPVPYMYSATPIAV